MHEGQRHIAPGTFAPKAGARAWLSAKETDINRGQWVGPSAGKVSGDYATEWADRQRCGALARMDVWLLDERPVRAGDD